jgi:Xaa-Pro aminopeptidase
MSELERRTTHTTFVLPLNVVSKGDVSRLMNELERVDGELTADSVREKVGATEHRETAMSQELTDFLGQNNLTLDNALDRAELIKEVRLLKDNAPVIHMTFAVPADGESLKQIAQWLRESVHPQTVVAVGIQPALIAGAYVRTPNHIHDLSLRAALADGHSLLVKELELLRDVK